MDNNKIIDKAQGILSDNKLLISIVSGFIVVALMVKFLPEATHAPLAGLFAGLTIFYNDKFEKCRRHTSDLHNRYQAELRNLERLTTRMAERISSAKDFSDLNGSITKLLKDYESHRKEYK